MLCPLRGGQSPWREAEGLPAWEAGWPPPALAVLPSAVAPGLPIASGNYILLVKAGDINT